MTACSAAQPAAAARCLAGRAPPARQACARRRVLPDRRRLGQLARLHLQRRPGLRHVNLRGQPVLRPCLTRGAHQRVSWLPRRAGGRPRRDRPARRADSGLLVRPAAVPVQQRAGRAQLQRQPRASWATATMSTPPAAPSTWFTTRSNGRKAGWAAPEAMPIRPSAGAGPTRRGRAGR